MPLKNPFTGKPQSLWCLRLFHQNGQFTGRAVAVCFPTVSCCTPVMTKHLDDALAAVRNLSPDEQDNIAHAVLRLTGTDEEPPVPRSAGERTAIAASKSAAARGEFASDAQVRAAWAKHDL